MRNAARDVWIPVGLVSVCIAVFFAVVVPPALRDLGPASFNSNSDLQTYFLPKYAFGSDELMRGRLPAWNVYEYGGLPFLATAQPAVFYPPKALLYALFEPSTAHWIFLLAHYVLATIGFALLTRELGLRREAAFVGAVAFLFSVPVLAGNYHPTRIANLCWMPFEFLLATRLLRGAGPRTFAFLALVVAFQLNAGYPEFTLDTALFLGIYVLAIWCAEWPKRPQLRGLFIVGAAFALGGVISAIQILPLGEVGVVARRAAVASQALSQVTGPKSFSLLTTLPYAFYVPGLIGFAVLAASSRKGWPALATVLLCIALINGGGDYLVKLPGFSMIRFPYAFILVTMFFPAFAAALGTDAFLCADGEGAERRPLVAVAVLAYALALAAFYVFRLLKAPAALAPFQTRAGVALTLVGLTLIAISAVLVLRRARAGEVVMAGALVLVVAQWAAFPFGAVSAPFARPAAQGEIKRLLGDRPLHGRSFSLYDILYGYNQTDRTASVFGIEESFLPWRLRQIHDRLRLIPIFSYVDMAALLGMRGFLNAMDLEYIAVKPEEASLLANEGFSEVARDTRAVLFHNTQRIAGAWVNYAVRRFASDDEALAHVLRKDFDPRREVVIGNQLGATYPEVSPYPATPARSILRPSPTELEIDVELPRPGVLVVSESAYPGWQVWVDGKAARWVEADYVLRGVELPVGAHHVSFRYHSRALRWGVVLSVLGLLVALACIFGERALKTRRFLRSTV